MAATFHPRRAGADPTTSADHPLAAVFAPKSVAVLGVTATPGTVPYDIFHNILGSGYRGTVYPVAPGKRSICAVRAYRYVLDIEDEVDQAVIVFPANVVERALEQCGEKGVKSAIVISAGFREVGPQGARARAAAEGNLRGIRHRHDRAELPGRDQHRSGSAIERLLRAEDARRRADRLSQPVGALVHGGARLRPEKQIGFSKFVSFGNKAGVTEIELFDYLHQDQQTDVILLYLEELRDGRGFDRGGPPRHARRRTPSRSWRSSRAARRKAPTPPPAIPARWPARTPSAMRSSARRASFASTASRKCSTRPFSTPTSPCRPATAWRLSPMRAGRA